MPIFGIHKVNATKDEKHQVNFRSSLCGCKNNVLHVLGGKPKSKAFVYAHVSNYEKETTKGPYDNGMQVTKISKVIAKNLFQIANNFFNYRRRIFIYTPKNGSKRTFLPKNKYVSKQVHKTYSENEQLKQTQFENRQFISKERGSKDN